MQIEEAIYGRRSIRSFSNDQISDEVLQKIIHAGVYAPSACNFQAWKFIIIDDERIKDEIVSRGGSAIIKKSPQGIMVTYRNNLMVTGHKHFDYVQSAAASIQNMLLMAYSLGVASCWICNLPSSKELRPVLNIPKDYSVIAYIALGYSTEGTGSTTEQMKYHYGNTDNFIKHKRRFSSDQVICHNRFQLVEGDCSTLVVKSKSKVRMMLKKIYKHLKRATNKSSGNDRNR